MDSYFSLYFLAIFTCPFFSATNMHGYILHFSFFLFYFASWHWHFPTSVCCTSVVLPLHFPVLFDFTFSLCQLSKLYKKDGSKTRDFLTGFWPSISHFRSFSYVLSGYFYLAVLGTCLKKCSRNIRTGLTRSARWSPSEYLPFWISP